MASSIDVNSGLAKAFQGKRIFITGHTGFKGSWLSIWLKELGAEVLGYSLEPPSVPNNFDVTRLSGKVIHTQGDIRNYPYLIKFFKKFEPEIVFHLAAQPIVRHSYDNPRETYETNVMGTIHMFEAIREASSVRAFINVTTDKCYENKEWLWGYRENDALGGHDPYSSSKACAELVSQAYIKSFFALRNDTGIASVRAGNVIGGGDWGADRLLPDCFRALSQGNQIALRNPQAVRPWQFVLEPLYGYLVLAGKLCERPAEYTGAWNYGPGNDCCIPVREVVNKIIHYWGSGSWHAASRESNDHKQEMTLLKLNSDKAYSLLGWRGVLNIDTAIAMTTNWYKTFYQRSGADMYAFCVEQIAEYMQRIPGMRQYEL